MGNILLEVWFDSLTDALRCRGCLGKTKWGEGEGGNGGRLWRISKLASGGTSGDFIRGLHFLPLGFLLDGDTPGNGCCIYPLL